MWSDYLRSLFLFSRPQRATHIPLNWSLLKLWTFSVLKITLLNPLHPWLCCCPHGDLPSRGERLRKSASAITYQCEGGGLLEAISFLRAAGPEPCTNGVQQGPFSGCSKGWMMPRSQSLFQIESLLQGCPKISIYRVHTLVDWVDLWTHFSGRILFRNRLNNVLKHHQRWNTSYLLSLEVAGEV